MREKPTGWTALKRWFALLPERLAYRFQPVKRWWNRHAQAVIVSVIGFIVFVTLLALLGSV